MEQAQKKTKVLSLFTSLSKLVPCPFFRAKERKILTQLRRKAAKAFDLEFVIKQAKINNSLNRAFLSQGQKLLIKFQMENLVGKDDFSDSSDNLQDVYSSKVEKSELLLNNIFTEFINKDELSYLDTRLLQGVFTNDREKLKTPNLFLKEAKNMEKSATESIFKKKRNKQSKKELSYIEEVSGDLEERS